MFLRNAFFGASLLALLANAAVAGPATQVEADRLSALFQSYVGPEPGVVTVTPSGDAYTLTLDFAPLIAKTAPETFSGTITPYVLMLTDNEDGTWSTTSDQAFSAKFSVAGLSDITYSIENWRSTGVFDETLGAFSKSRSEFSTLSAIQLTSVPGAAPTQSISSAAQGSYESTASAGLEGGIDSKITYAFTNYSQAMDLPGPPGVPPAQVTVTAENYIGDGALSAVDPAAFYKLIAWFVAHPSTEAIKADQAGLKTVLMDGIPFFRKMNMTGSLKNAAISTPVGVFTVQDVGVVVEANGLITDGLVREGITLSGLTIPAGLAPDWAADLLPKDVTFDVAVSGFDAAAPIAAMIAAFDLTKPEPLDAEMGPQVLAMLLPKGTVDVKLAPGRISGPLYSLSYEGAMTAGPGSVPVGSATVTMTGFDAVMAALQAGPPEMTGQLGAMLGMASGMAKPGVDGVLVWAIDATTPGTLLVNGVDMMMMLGGR